MLDMMLLVMQNDHKKMVGFANDVTTSRNLEALRRWWDALMEIARIMVTIHSPQSHG